MQKSGYDITSGIWRRNDLNDAFATIESQLNDLTDDNFSNVAEIDGTKFSSPLLLQSHVACTSPANVLRTTSNSDYQVPLTIGNGTQYIIIIYNQAALSFAFDGLITAYVDPTGWNNGFPTTTDPYMVIDSASIGFDRENSYWTIYLDGVAKAYIDPLNNAGVFINTVPAGTRQVCQGASIYFNSVDLTIDFRYNGNIIGYIDITGMHEGGH